MHSLLCLKIPVHLALLRVYILLAFAPFTPFTIIGFTVAFFSM